MSKNRKLSIVGAGTHNPDIVLVVDRTSVKTSVSGNIFAGKEGAILNSFIRMWGSGVDSLWITPCVACPTESSIPGERPKEVLAAPKASHIRSCRPWLHQEIGILEPTMLIAMGPVSVDALRGESFTQSRGRVVEANIIGESLDYKLPMMVIDSVMTLLRSAQNPDKIWNKNLAYVRCALGISNQLKGEIE